MLRWRFGTRKRYRDGFELYGRARVRSREDRVGLDYLASRPRSQDRVHGMTCHHWLGQHRTGGKILQHTQKTR